jgi:glycosyltransferase involved in cell wall biosynthesis
MTRTGKIDVCAFHLLTGGEGYGVATVLGQLATHLPQIGVIALTEGTITTSFSDECVTCLRVKPLDVAVGRSSLGGILKFAAALPRWWLIARKIEALLPKKPAVLHCHSLGMTVLAILVRRRRNAGKIKVIYHFHSTMNSTRLFGLLAKAQRLLIGRSVDAIIAVSAAVAAYWGRPRCPLYVIHNGVDCVVRSTTPEFLTSSPRPGSLNVILAGSLSVEKGQLTALEALKILSETKPEIHLWIAGGPLDLQAGTFASLLALKIRELGLEQRVTLMGEIKNLRSILPSMWLALQMRTTPEPCSMWVLECMSAGLPLVASATGGTPELVRDGNEALLVPPGNATETAAAILQLARDTRMHERLAENLRTRAEMFTTQAFIRKIEDVYRDLQVPIV